MEVLLPYAVAVQGHTVEDARRFLEHPYLAEDPQRLTMGIVVEDPEHPDERAQETARRIEVLGAKTMFVRKRVHRLYVGPPPIARPREKDEED